MNNKILFNTNTKRYWPGGVIGNILEKGSYNIFTDPNAEKARKEHRQSLEAFVQKNPTLYGLNTADFVDYFSQLAGLEGSYKSNSGAGNKYSGYYGLEGGRNYSSDEQHRMAFQHLANVFKENITKADLEQARKRGITPAQLLTKYWNNGNNATNWIWHNIDAEDRIGTKVSEYGNNITAKLNYSKYLPDAITDDYVIVKNSRTLPDAIKLARNPKMQYSNRKDYILNLNSRNGKPLDAGKLQVNDTIWLVPR